MWNISHGKILRKILIILMVNYQKYFLNTKFGVSDINQFGVDGTYFCTTDNCLSHYMENPGYNGEEYFDLKDDAIIAISEDEFLLDFKKERKEIMSKADGFYCPPYDTYGIIIWGKNKLL
jgi:hypothetical protein